MESPSMLAPTTNVVSASSSVPFYHRYYVLLKAHYFLFFSAFGIIYPILSVTLRDRGLSNAEIAYTNLIIPFLVFFINPWIGFIADHTRRYLLTFNSILVVVISLYICMFLLSPISSDKIKANMVYDDRLGHVLDFCASQEAATQCSARSECGCAYTALCVKQNVSFDFNFTMNAKHTRHISVAPTDMSHSDSCGLQYRVPVNQSVANYSSLLQQYSEHDSALDHCYVTCSIPRFCHGIRHSNQTFYVMLYALLLVIATTLLSIDITIGASIGFASLPRPDIFGEQRVCGTVGFGLSAFTASLLYDRLKTDKVYITMFSIAATICICITSMIRIQPHKHHHKETNDNVSNTKEGVDDVTVENITRDIKENEKPKFKAAALIPLLKDLDVIVFLTLTFIWGMSYAALDPYLYLFIDEIAPCKSRSIIGWMSLISASAEVIALFIAARMLKLLGTNLSSVIILVAFSIRFAGYYLIKEPYYLLFMETMHYFNFGILYVLIAQKADAIAPSGLAGTLQGVVYGVSFGLGRGVGLIACSFIYTRLQSRSLFLIFSIFDMSVAIIYSFYLLLRRKSLNRPIRSNKNLNIPKIVIESETNLNQEPLLSSSSTKKLDDNAIDQ